MRMRMRKYVIYIVRAQIDIYYLRMRVCVYVRKEFGWL